MQNLSSVMKSIRQKRGINQKELANALNISPTYLNLIEKDERIIPLDFIDKLNLILNLNAEEINMLYKAIELSKFNRGENEMRIARINQVKQSLIKLIDSLFVKIRSNFDVDNSLIDKIIELLQNLKQNIFDKKLCEVLI